MCFIYCIGEEQKQLDGLPLRHTLIITINESDLWETLYV